MRASKRGLTLALLAFFTRQMRALPPAETGDDQAAIAHFDALLKNGGYPEAASLLEQYLAAHPASWRALYQLGYADFRLQRIGPSLKALSKSLELHSEFADAHKVLAFDLNILGRQDLAVRELEYAIRLDPNSAESHYELGRIRYERADYGQAVKELEQAKALEPTWVKTYHNLGLAYTAMNEHAKALENFEAGVRLNALAAKPSAWPLIDFATYYNLQNDYAKARDLLQEAVRLDNRWEKAYEELSKACRGLGDTACAIDSLKRALAIDPKKAEYHYVLARLYSQQHRSSEAKQELAEYARDRAR